MSLKKWLQKNQVYDTDLLRLFPKYGVNDPEKDLGKLKPDQWKEIQETIKSSRAKELKDNAAKQRLQKKLTKVEKLWKAKRPKKKPKEPKLLKIDDDTASTKTKSTKKKKAGHKSPKSSPTKSPKSPPTKPKKGKTKKIKSPEIKPKTTTTKSPETTANGYESKQTAAEETWDEYDTLRLSDTEKEEPTESTATTTTYKVPTLITQGSVVDALMAGPYQPDHGDTDDNKIAEIDTTDINDENKAEWDHYDDLKLSDGEEEEEEKESTPSNGGDTKSALFVPLFPLKTQGSVVDMLMSGPTAGDKDKVAVRGLVVTPPEPDIDTGNAVQMNGPEEIGKDYSITVSDGVHTEVKVDGHKKEVEQKDEEVDEGKKVMVSVNADAFVYNEELDVYTISLSYAKLLKCDHVARKLTFEIKGNLVNKDKSEKAEKQMDDMYIDKVLDEINRDNPDSEAEDQ